MSTQAVSGISLYQELQSFYSNRQTDVQALGKALESGDLNAAQQAYDQLVSLGQNGPFANQEPFSRANRAQDFEAIGKALSSGDLAGAQAAFAQLLQALSQTNGGPTTATSTSPAYVVQLAPQLIQASQNAPAPASSTNGTESIYQLLQAFRSTRSTDLQQLGQALAANDLKGAQQAFNNLVQLGQQGPFADRGPFERADRAQAFQALGQALTAGDLAGAQRAFATFESIFTQGNHGGPIPPVYKPGSGPNGTTTGTATPPAIPEIVINIGAPASTSPPAATPGEIVLNLPTPAANTNEEVQINFGGSNGQGQQLTVDVGLTQGTRGPAGEQITIDLAQANNNQSIVLNLFGAGAAPSPQTQGSTLNVHS